MNLTELRELAVAATQGPYFATKGHIGDKIVDFVTCLNHDGIRVHWGSKYGESTPESEATAKIFAASRELLDRVQAAESRLTRIEALARGVCEAHRDCPVETYADLQDTIRALAEELEGQGCEK